MAAALVVAAVLLVLFYEVAAGLIITLGWSESSRRFAVASQLFAARVEGGFAAAVLLGIALTIAGLGSWAGAPQALLLVATAVAARTPAIRAYRRLEEEGWTPPDRASIFWWPALRFRMLRMEKIDWLNLIVIAASGAAVGASVIASVASRSAR